MKTQFWAATDTGKTRTHNEDNFLVDKKLKVFVVADGMGGHASGEIASSLCVRKVRDAVAANEDLVALFAKGDGQVERRDVLRLMEHAVQDACSAIFQKAQKEPEKRGMGTTCTMLMICGQRGFMAHVGDSRLYLARHGQVHQLSDDHSLENELIKRGKIKPNEFDQSAYKDYKNAVTRAVGVYESVEVDTLDFEVLPDDEFLLCSDGLHAYLDDAKILELIGGETIREVPQRFIDLANDGGGHDNITSVVVRLVAEREEEARTRELSLKFNVLKGMPVFRYLSYKELVRVMNITEVRSFQDGQEIFHEGAKGQELYILLEGKVRILMHDAVIATLEQGDHFGEMALLDSAPRSATALAEGKTRLLVVGRKEFYQIIRREDRLSVRLLWSFLQVLTERLRKTSAELSDTRAMYELPDLTGEIDLDSNN